MTRKHKTPAVTQQISDKKMEPIPSTIEEFLQQQQEQDLLRFITCGSVDDGKSTLIGRLLWDSRQL